MVKTISLSCILILLQTKDIDAVQCGFVGLHLFLPLRRNSDLDFGNDILKNATLQLCHNSGIGIGKISLSLVIVSCSLTNEQMCDDITLDFTYLGAAKSCLC